MVLKVEDYEYVVKQKHKKLLNQDFSLNYPSLVSYRKFYFILSFCTDHLSSDLIVIYIFNIFLIFFYILPNLFIFYYNFMEVDWLVDLFLEIRKY
jgi:hypothetical protein